MVKRDPPYDFRAPDMVAEYARRLNLLAKLRDDPGMMAAFRVHYLHNPADFIDDFGVTFDPRNIERNLPAVMPFVLFPKQRELIETIVERWRAGKPLLIEKSRDVGASWIMIGVGVALCVFHDGMVVGYGSRKEEYVDKLDSPKSLFYKARIFIKHLPPEFRAGWMEKRHGAHMRLTFPNTGAAMTGEAGDNIGRGDRTSLYFVDESAHLERPQLIEASLSATTNCRIDASSVAGMDNPFAIKRHAGKIRVFILDWRDDPRKDQAWYAEQCELLDPVTVAQEIDRNYSASVEGIVIPNEWIQAAVDAFDKLGITPTGKRLGALDVADEGIDANAYAGRYGAELQTLSEWSGKGDDIFGTVNRAFTESEEFGASSFLFDSDGLGAGVRGDARVLNEARAIGKLGKIEALPFRGSGAVVDPDKPIPLATDVALDRDKQARTNADYFANAKAQGWWNLRVRFQRTYRAVTKGAQYNPDELISLSSKSITAATLAKLTVELSRPTYSLNGAGKILIDKAPDGSRSPNLADAVMICYSPQPRRGGFFSN
jgi:phage terminase large subunit